jgi:hypothetical protein
MVVQRGLKAAAGSWPASWGYNQRQAFRRSITVTHLKMLKCRFLLLRAYPLTILLYRSIGKHPELWSKPWSSIWSGKWTGA